MLLTLAVLLGDTWWYLVQSNTKRCPRASIALNHSNTSSASKTPHKQVGYFISRIREFHVLSTAGNYCSTYRLRSDRSVTVICM